MLEDARNALECGAGKAASSRRTPKLFAHPGVARDYSLRSLVIGSVRLARRAGIWIAGNATAATATTASSSASGSAERAGAAPLRNLRAGVGDGVARPQDGPVTGIERIQDSGGAQCVYAAMAEGGRAARTWTAVRLVKTSCVSVSPHRLAGGQPVAGNQLVGTALLLGVEEVTANRERRPPWPDRTPP